MLEGKVAVIYGGGGAIGAAVARAFASEGAAVYLAGRTQEPLLATVEQIRVAGGLAWADLVDALDELAVDRYVDTVVHRAGRLDISCNVIGYQDVQRPLLELTPAEFLQPITTATRAQFLTTRAAARQMIPAGHGVILTFGGGGPQTLSGLGGFKVALDAVESLRRQWAVELGPHGIRVVSIVTGGIPETIPADQPARAEIAAGIAAATQLGRAATLADVGQVAAFLASDRAAAMTSATANISAGAIVDY